ncbi:MAG: dephospho-CoA kinase [Pseudomonadota bacterium]
MSFRLALTGSIGMGKSTAAGIFAEFGVPVWDADVAVHRLYQPGAAGAEAIAVLLPEAVTETGVDRAKLREAMTADEGLLSRVQDVIHPLVAKDRADFAESRSEDFLLFDVPLVFELGNEGDFDAVAVVTTTPDLQDARVLARPGMTRASYDFIRSQQLPDAEKRAKADFLIDSTSMDTARRDITSILDTIGARHA